MFDKILNSIQLRYKKVEFKNITIYGRIYVHGPKHRVFIGDGVVINSDEKYNPTSGFSHSHLLCNEVGVIRIGDSCGISSVCITSYSEGGVTIGNNVTIGSGVCIWDTDFHPIKAIDRINQIDERTISKAVVIQDGVFIGARTLVLKGVTIGENSVVGAGSVVTRNIPPNEIWAGNPANFVKKLEASCEEY